MTVPFLTSDELVAHLKSNGFEVVDDRLYEETNRISMGKDGRTFPLNLERVNFFHKVVTLCRSLNIPAPADHQKCYDQYVAMKARQSSSD